MGRKLLVSVITVCMCATALSGCRNKSNKVDYSIDENGTSAVENTVVAGEKGLSQYQDITNWSDSYTVTKDNGESIPIDINCNVTIPDATQMSVVEGSFLTFDASYMEDTAKKIYGDSPIYYYDYARRPKDELKAAIDELNEQITENESDINNGWHEGEYLDYFKTYVENLKTELQKCKDNQNTASDNYIPVTDYDSDKYIGEINGKMYILSFSDTVQGFGGYENIKREITLEPKNLTDIASASCEQYNAICLSQNTEAMQNNCKYSQDEAVEIAENFMKDLSFTDHSLCKVYGLMWECGESLDEYGDVDSTEYAEKNGYTVMFTQPVDKDNNINSIEQNDQMVVIDGMEFSSSMGNEQHAILTVSNDGVVMMSIVNSYKITNETKNVSLISFDSLKGILKAEIEKNKNDYDYTEGTVYFTSLKLQYLLVSEDTFSDNFSYIPVWCLKDDDCSYSIFINAIDGTCIDVSNLEKDLY